MKKLFLSFLILFSLTLSISAQSKKTSSDKKVESTGTTEKMKMKQKMEAEEKAAEIKKKDDEAKSSLPSTEPFRGSKTEYIRLKKQSKG